MAFSIVLYDDYTSRNHLLPLVATRPISNLRVGILTIDEKWRRLLKQQVSFHTVDYLRAKFPYKHIEGEILLINGNVLPSASLADELFALNFNSVIVDNEGDWIAVKISSESIISFVENDICRYNQVVFKEDIDRIKYPEDIFLENAKQITFDLEFCLELNNQCYINKSVHLDNVVLDDSLGPIFIDESVQIESAVVIKGPVALCKGSRVKSGTYIYPNVTIGPNTTVCGEINNTVIWGNSAKGHEGYLGCAVIGEGCNLGAGTTNSNLKNDWSTVKLYDYSCNDLRDTTLLKCGVIIGDQVMLGIHTKITTGSVIGVGAQVAMSKFLPKFVPDFAWYTEDKEESYIFARFIEMMRRKSTIKKEAFTKEDENIFDKIYRMRILEKNFINQP